MAAACATSIATIIFKYSLGAIVQHVGYLWNHKKNITNLKTQVEKLDCVRVDKSHSVLVAQKNAEKIRSQVESWQNDAEKISLEARNIMELYEENTKKRCLIRLCPNAVSYYQLSKKACKKQLEIVEAVTEANQFNKVADPAIQRAMSTLSIEGYLTFDSRKSTLEEIMKTLKDVTKNSIGVYGLGGMGKTTLAKQVASRAAEEKLFDEIVMAPVTKTPKLKEIQGEIAKKLDLKLEESSVAERAGRIHERLKNSKVLVILDDLWEKLELEKVGIPFGVEHVGCKILFTSRFQSVLSSMGSKKNFPLGALKEEEAWRLFEEKTADVVKNPTFLKIGKKVAKICAGLPVLIVTVAASLSSRPKLPVWMDALKELQKMNYKEVHEIINSAVEYISYNHLEKTHKRLFLLCGLLGSGNPMTDYLKYSWGWNLFDEDVVKLEEARNKLHALILDLKASCLLLDGENEDIIEIHDVVRSVAVSLARKNQNMFSFGEVDTELIRWPNDDVLRSCTAMVFQGCRDLPCLSKRLECPSLELFCLNGFSLDTSPTIPNTFFERTRELKVLDMTKLCFPVLPSSLSCLKNLQTLCLDFCTNLEDISMIGDLKKLQVLSFIGADIKELPRGIGLLSELRLLDLSRCSKLEIIPAGLLAGLSNLQELYMSQSFNRWEAEECHRSNSERRTNVSLAELKQLLELRSLEIEVQDVKLLAHDLNFERLERYRIIAGDINIMNFGIDKKGISRELGLNLVTTGINHLQNGVKELLKRTESLCLRELKGVKNVIGELDRDGFTDLKHLSIQSNCEIQFIVNVDLKHQRRAFPELESLYLSDLLKLEKICNGRLMQDSFCTLTTVNVLNCNKLESLFSFSMAIDLPCLQELQVSECSILKGIVAKRSREEANVNTNDKIEIVHQLRKLSVECLPQIISFYSCAKMLPILTERQKLPETYAHSEEIFQEEEECTSSIPFFKEVSFHKLEELKLSEISNLTEIWGAKLPEKSYCNLKSLVVQKCSRLVSVFSSNLLELSRKLEVLNVNCCDLLEEVFVAPDGLDIDEEHNGLVPQLIELCLVDLPKLGCIWRNYQPGILSFKNLQDLSVEKCSSLKYLFTPSITAGLVRLKTLTIKSCVMMKEIVVKEEGSKTTDAIIFPQLSSLYLEDLPNLTTFYSEGEEIGSNENIHTSIQSLFNAKVKFPSLESLAIGSLDNIKSIWYNQPNEEDSFCKLEHVEVRKCAKLLKIFPSTMLNKIQGVKEVWIVDCDSLDEVFEVQIGLNLKEITDVTTVSRLRDLQLENLPKLRYVWNMGFHKILSFDSLWHVDVRGCENLKHVLSDVVARNLHQLEQLIVMDCKEVETIVDVEVDDEDENKEVGEEEVSTTFILPKLTQVRLFRLQKVECFYPKKHTMEWPALEELIVYDCNKLSFGELVMNVGQNQLEKLLCRLKVLTIGGKDMKMMTRHFDHFPHEFFLNLQQLCLTDFDGDESAAFPSNFLCRLPHLETLQVNKSPIQEIFVYEGEGPPVSLPHLTYLTLAKLSELKYIWKEDSQCLIPILHKLGDLYIRECPHLTNLVPHGMVSFKFLTELQVVSCDGFIKLIQSSTAASLEQLKLLAVIGCQMIEEIVAADDGDDHDSQVDHDIIIFSKLQNLQLEDLPKLTSFCTANYTFKFPELTTVKVIQCPNMKTFSTGFTITPMLHKVYLDDSDDQHRWNGDLNATVQHFFSETETLGQIFPDQFIKLIEGIFEEFTRKPREEIGIFEQCNDPVEEKVNISGDATKPGKGKEKVEIEMSEEDPNYQDQPSSSYTSTMPFYGESSVSTEQQSEKSEDTVPSSLSPANEPEEQTNAGLNSLLSEEKETKRLDTTDQSTSSKNHFEPEAKQIESSGKEVEEISEESTEPREEGQTRENSTDELAMNESTIEPREQIVDSSLESIVSKKPLPFTQIDHMPFYEVGESSLPSKKQGEKSEETTAAHSDPSSLSPTNEPEEETSAGSLAPPDVVASSLQLSPASNHLATSPSRVTEAGTSRAASNSQQNISQILHATKEFSALLSEFLQAHPLNIAEESTSEPREEIRTFEPCNDPLGEKVNICAEATKPGKGKEKIEISEEDPNYQDQANSSYTSTTSLFGESSVSTEQPSEKSEETVPSSLSPANEPEEQTNAGSLAPRDVVTPLLLSPASNHPETSPSLVTEAGTSIAGSNSQQNDFQISRVTQELITLLSEIHHIRQTQPLDSMSEEQVQFMLDAFHSLSSMNFTDLFSPFVEKVRERLSSIERKKEISEIDLRVAELKAQMQALEEKKKVLEEKN